MAIVVATNANSIYNLDGHEVFLLPQIHLCMEETGAMI